MCNTLELLDTFQRSRGNPPFLIREVAGNMEHRNRVKRSEPRRHLRKGESVIVDSRHKEKGAFYVRSRGRKSPDRPFYRVELSPHNTVRIRRKGFQVNVCGGNVRDDLLLWSCVDHSVGYQSDGDLFLSKETAGILEKLEPGQRLIVGERDGGRSVLHREARGILRGYPLQ